MKRIASVRALACCAVVLGFAAPALAQTELEVLKQQVEELRNVLEQQRQVMENQKKAIERLEKVGAQSAPEERVQPATALAIPVLSKSQMEIYGALLPFAENIRGADATASPPADRPNQLPASAYTGVNQPSRNRMTVGTSNIGFRGSIPIVGEYAATWQIEAGAAIDGDSASIGGSNVFGLRNSAVGASGPFGAAFFGNWDTPYKWSSIFSGALRGSQQFDAGGLIGNPGFGVLGTTTQSGRAAGKADAAFDRRQGNSVQYWTPAWNGLSARVAYSFGEGKPSFSAVPLISPTVWSTAVSYENAGLILRYAHEQHKDYFGMSQIGGAAPSATNTSSKDYANKLVASYSFGNTSVTGVYEQLHYNNDDSGAAANVKEYKRNAYYVIGQQKFGQGSKVFASYASASDGSCSTVGGVACSTNGLGAKEWALGFVQSINKYFDVYVAYYDIKNRGSGTYEPVTSLNVPLNGTPAPGLNLRSIGAGVVIVF